MGIHDTAADLRDQIEKDSTPGALESFDRLYGAFVQLENEWNQMRENEAKIRDACRVIRALFDQSS